MLQCFLVFPGYFTSLRASLHSQEAVNPPAEGLRCFASQGEKGLDELFHIKTSTSVLRTGERSSLGRNQQVELHVAISLRVGYAKFTKTGALLGLEYLDGHPCSSAGKGCCTDQLWVVEQEMLHEEAPRCLPGAASRHDTISVSQLLRERLGECREGSDPSAHAAWGRLLAPRHLHPFICSSTFGARI